MDISGKLFYCIFTLRGDSGIRSGTGKVFFDFSKRSQARKKVIASSVESAHRRPEVVELVSGHVLVVVPPAVTPHAVFTG